MLRTPGRNADGVAEMTVGAADGGHPPRASSADRDVRAGEVYRDGSIPYQRFRAWQIAGRTAGLVGLGAVGRAVKWRLEGLGMTVIASDPYAARRHPRRSTTCSPRPTSCRCTRRSRPRRSG